MCRYVALLSAGYLLGLLVVWALLGWDGGQLWPVTLFLFAPRWVVALPLLILVPWTLLCRWRWAAAFLLHGAVILFPILGFQVPSPPWEAADQPVELRLMSCNLGGGPVSIRQIVQLVRQQKIEALLLQECSSSTSQALFGQLGWTFRQHGNLAIGTCFGLGAARVIARHSDSNYQAVAAVACEVELSTERSRERGAGDASDNRVAELVSVHLPTFRPALEKARAFDLDAGEAIQARAGAYRHAAEQLLYGVARTDGPVIIAGDFNVPVESAHYRDYWGNWSNALSREGTGFGYTKTTRYHGVRIDHVLVDDSWTIVSAWVGADFGGDHRPVIVEIGWRPEGAAR